MNRINTHSNIYRIYLSVRRTMFNHATNASSRAAVSMRSQPCHIISVIIIIIVVVIIAASILTVSLRTLFWRILQSCPDGPAVTIPSCWPSSSFRVPLQNLIQFCREIVPAFRRCVLSIRQCENMVVSVRWWSGCQMNERTNNCCCCWVLQQVDGVLDAVFS